EVLRGEREDQDDEAECEQHRRRTEVAGAGVVPDPTRQRLERRRDVGCLRSLACLRSRRHPATSERAVPGMPETFVGCPAVIACTTSSCVTFARSNTPAFRPRRSTVIRVAVSNTSWRLCEIRTTPSPCS